MNDEAAMVDEMVQFQEDLLESVLQMKSARVSSMTEASLLAAAEIGRKTDVLPSVFDILSH